LQLQVSNVRKVTDKNDVEKFLNEFRVKLKVFDVVYIDREKNIQALLDLDMFPIDRRMTLEKLNVEDYCEGPLEETMHGGSKMWVFGREISGKEVYIKIALGHANRPVVCVSFHIAERTLNYPFK